ncbi:MAG: phosphatidylserine decarboxylase, partial [Sphingomonadales bacterium]
MYDLLNSLPPIHREGRRFIIIFAAITLALFYLWVPFGLLGIILTIWCTYFFRDPERVTPRRAGLVISPADGVVCAIDQVHWPQELRYGGPVVWRISIFMNVFNVHVNRIPIAGEIT